MNFEPKYGDCENTLLAKIAGMINAGGGGGGGSGVASFNARTGAVSLTSGDVTTALGFTPANSATPVVNSFNTRSGVVSLTSGDVTTALGFTPTDAAALSNYLLKSGGTMTGALLFTDNTIDIGASGATRPRTGFFGTSVVAPLFTGNLTGTVTGHATLDLALTGGTLTGALLFSTDNTLDIGANGATRPRTGYFGTSVISPLFTGALTGAASLNVLKAGDTMTGLLTITQATTNTAVFSPGGGSLTGSDATTFFNYSGTWNTSGAPTAFKLNITNTAAGASALLLDLQSSTVSRFSVAQESTTLITRVQADTSGAVLALQKRGTTGDITAAVANGDTICSLEARGWDGANYGPGFTFRGLALEAFTASARGTRLVIGIPAVGSATATARFDLRATALALTNGCTMNVALGTITAAQLVYDGSVTWNAAVTFTAHRVTVTNTSSNAASLLCNYLVGAASVFAVRVDGQIQKNGVELLNPLSVYAAGTVYTLTTTNAKVTFGTTSPSFTLTAVGTYRLSGSVKVQLNGATFAANQTVTVLLRRTNNTAGNLTNSGSTFTVPIVTTLTETLAIIRMNDVHYTTANTDDVIEIWADVSALPSAGTISIDAASLTAIRIA